MKRLIAASVIIFVVGILFCPRQSRASIFDRDPREKSRSRIRKSATLTRAEEAFVKGDYEEVIILGSAFGTYKAGSDDEIQYLMGRALLKLGRFDEARNRFSRILNNSDSDKFLDKAYMGLGDSYYLEGKYIKAKSNYEKVLNYFDDSDDMPIVYYRLGECYYKLGNNTSSKQHYDKLLDVYPDSLEARLLIGEKADFVAYSVQAGSFTKWSNAKRLHDELNKKGFEATIYTAIVGDSRFYRVRVGQYKRLDDAEDMARRLRNKGYTIKIYP